MVAPSAPRPVLYTVGPEQAPPAGGALREVGPTAAPKPRLLDRVRATLRARHYSRRTEESYVAWIRRYIFFHNKRHPVEMGAPEVTAFLTSLAVRGRVAASTQNQALSALLFLYRDVLEVDLPWLDGIVRAKRPVRLPVVLNRDEVRALFQRLEGVPRLMACLLYGGGLRVLECCRLRVQDVDFAASQIVVRSGKGDKDRVTMLPAVVKAELGRHLARVRAQHRDDLAAAAGWVELPTALLRKYPNAGREWVWQWTPHHLSSGNFPAPLEVVERAAREHRDENPERAIRDASESTGVSMPLAPEAVVMGTTVRVILNTGASPVIEGVAQARIARVAHADAERLTALPRHRGDATVRPQSVVVSLCQRPRGLGEHRGGDDSPDSRQGPEDSRVTMLSWNLLRAEFLQQRFGPGGDFSALLVQQPQARQQQGNVGTGGLHRARSHVQRWGLQRLPDRRHRKAPDAIDLEHRCHGLRRQALGVGRGRDAIKQRPEPRVVPGRAEGEGLGKEPVQLLPQSVAESPKLLAQVVLDAGQFAKLHDTWVIGLHAPEGRAIGSQGVGKDEGVAPVILGPGDRVPVAKAIELLGIEREHMNAVFEQGIDDGAARHFDGDGDAAGLRWSQSPELVGQVVERHAGVRNAPFGETSPLAIENAHHMRLASPIHTHEELVLRL